MDSYKKISMIIEKSESFIANINGLIVILKITLHKGNR